MATRILDLTVWALWLFFWSVGLFNCQFQSLQLVSLWSDPDILMTYWLSPRSYWQWFFCLVMQQRIRFEMNYASDAVITRANIEEEAACSTLHFSCFENQLSGIAIKMSTNINLKFNKNARALITHFYLHTLEYLNTNFPQYTLKSTWVIPFTCWAFKLILKALNYSLTTSNCASLKAKLKGVSF